MARASDKAARTDRGWRAAAPKTREQRRRLLARCAASVAFPSRPPGESQVGGRSDGEKPVPCLIDCRGLRAAKSRARQCRHRTLEKKATRLRTAGFVPLGPLIPADLRRVRRAERI